MPLIQAVIFDLDGTLVDSMPGIHYAINEAAGTLLPGCQVGENQISGMIGPPIRQILEKSFAVRGEILEKLVEAFRSAYDRTGWQKSVAYPGVVETLTELERANIRSFVVTNKPKSPTLQILAALHLGRFFVDIVSPDTVYPSFISKAEAIGYVMASHGLLAHTTLMVGDTVDDAQAALANDVTFVPVNYGYGIPEGGSNSLSTITELLLHLQLSEAHND